MADVSTLIDYYQNLLIIQYHGKDKAQQTMALLARMILASGIMFDVQDGYNIDTAEGKQLDVIGKYVGVDRYFKGQDLEDYFSLIKYEEVDSPPADRNGFSDYTDFDTLDGKVLKYSDVLSENLILSDSDFRLLIKLRIIQNSSNQSHASIDNSLFQFFGTDLYADWTGTMAMTYFVSANADAIIRVAIDKGLLPRPMGVQIANLVTITTTFFGFSTYASEAPDIEGFADYSDYDTKEGEILRYSKIEA